MSNINHEYVTDAREFAMQLRLMRVERRISLQQAAAAVGIDHTTLSRIELGHRGYMKVDLLVKLLHFYGLSLKVVESSHE